MPHPIARIISADSHVMEPRDLWEKALSARFGDLTPRLVRDPEGRRGTFFYTGRQFLQLAETDASAQRIGLAAAGFDPAVRVEFQRRADVDAELLHATLALLLMQGRQRSVARAGAQVFNDWLAEFCSHDPARLLGVGIIPMDDPNWAATELLRVARKGLRGVAIHFVPPSGCTSLRDARFDTFWAAAQDSDIPITLHIVAGQLPDPLHFQTAEERSNAPAVLIELMHEVAGVLANEFIFGGVLDRFPRLKLVCSEFEISWIPHFMWRLDQMQADLGGRLDLPSLAMKASDYMRTRIWHGLIDDPLGLEAIPHIGAGQVLWGSDFPHVRSIGLDARHRLEGMFNALSAVDRNKISGDNAASIYRI